MTKKSLLFLLALIGLGLCGDSTRMLRADEEAAAIVKPLLTTLKKGVVSKDTAALSTLFSKRFLFHGCRGDYDTKKIVSLLTSIPSGSEFKIDLKSAQFVDDDKSILFEVMTTGFGNPVNAIFVLHIEGGKYLMFGGKIPECPKTNSRFISEGETPKKVVEAFLVKFEAAVRSAEQAKISALILDDFTFIGCKGTYDKLVIVKMLMGIPKSAEFKMNVLSAEVINSNGDIEYAVSTSGFGPPPGINAKFTLKHVDGQLFFLQSGYVPSCSKPAPSQSGSKFDFSARELPLRRQGPKTLAGAKLHGSPPPIHKRSKFPIPREFAQDYVRQLIKAVKAHDAAKIGSLISDDVLLRGCSKYFTKAQAVAILSKVDKFEKIDKSLFEGLSARSRTIDGKKIIEVSTKVLHFTLLKVDSKYESYILIEGHACLDFMKDL